MIMVPSFWFSVLDTKNAFFALPARRKAVTDLGVVVDVTTLEEPLASRRSSVLSRLAPTVISFIENGSASNWQGPGYERVVREFLTHRSVERIDRRFDAPLTVLRTNVRADLEEPPPASKLSQEVVVLHWNLAVRRAKQDLIPTEVACPFKSTPLIFRVSMLTIPPAVPTSGIQNVMHVNR